MKFKLTETTVASERVYVSSPRENRISDLFSFKVVQRGGSQSCSQACQIFSTFPLLVMVFLTDGGVGVVHFRRDIMRVWIRQWNAFSELAPLCRRPWRPKYIWSTTIRWPSSLWTRHLLSDWDKRDNATRGPSAGENKENAQGKSRLVFELTDKKGCYVPIVTILGYIRDSSSIFDRKGVTRGTLEYRVAKDTPKEKEWVKWLCTLHH